MAGMQSLRTFETEFQSRNEPNMAEICRVLDLLMVGGVVVVHLDVYVCWQLARSRLNQIRNKNICVEINAMRGKEERKKAIRIRCYIFRRCRWRLLVSAAFSIRDSSGHPTNTHHLHIFESDK